MSSAQRKPAWPVWLWAMQLLPAAFLLVFTVARVSSKEVITEVDVKTWAALVITIGWLAGALAMLVLPKGRGWVVHRAADWVTIAVSSAVSLVLLDIALTLTGIVPTLETWNQRSIRYTTSTYTKSRLIPQEILVDGADPIQIHRRGFRGDDVEPAERAGYRIVFLGGSQVFDYHGGGWPDKVGAELRDRGYAVEVINAGVPGHTSTDSLGKLVTDLWLLRPDLVFTCHTWNDIKYFARLAPDEPYRGLPPLDPSPKLLDWRLYPRGIDRILTISSLYRSVRVALIEFLITEEGQNRGFVGGVYSDGPPDRAALRPEGFGPQQLALNLRLIGTLTRSLGAESILCRQARLESGAGTTGMSVEEYAVRNTRLRLDQVEAAFDAANSVIEELAAETQIEVIDMHAILGARAEHFHDGLHFSPAGSTLVAKTVADLLEPRLRRASGGDGAALAIP